MKGLWDFHLLQFFSVSWDTGNSTYIKTKFAWYIISGVAEVQASCIILKVNLILLLCYNHTFFQFYIHLKKPNNKNPTKNRNQDYMLRAKKAE